MPELKSYTCPSCKKEIKVSTGSAGETITCPICNTQSQLPSLRELRLLPAYIDTQAVKPTGRAVSEQDRRMGLILLLGLIFLIFAGLTAYWGYLYYQVSSINSDNWNIFDTWNQWQYLRPGIDSLLSENEQNWFYQLRQLWSWITVFGTIAIFCLMGILALWIAPYRTYSKDLAAASQK